jgi:quercetin dioxygenase-like cupin family protein
MPVVRDPGSRPARQGPGWEQQAWVTPQLLGVPVPMQAWRWRLGPAAASPVIGLGAPEGMLYLAAGSGTAEVGGQQFALGPESVLWLAGCPQVILRGGRAGLDALLAVVPSRAGDGAGASAQPPRLFAAADLPHLVSTRDSRDRLDLITDAVPVRARQIRAGRVTYHPGDATAAHSHTACHHVFCILAGAGLLCTEQQVSRLSAGMSAYVGPGEVHWLVNDTDADFSFVEFWAPPPAGTVWTTPGDRSTWAPAS